MNFLKFHFWPFFKVLYSKLWWVFYSTKQKLVKMPFKLVGCIFLNKCGFLWVVNLFFLRNVVEIVSKNKFFFARSQTLFPKILMFFFQFSKFWKNCCQKRLFTQSSRPHPTFLLQCDPAVLMVAFHSLHFWLEVHQVLEQGSFHSSMRGVDFFVP